MELFSFTFLINCYLFLRASQVLLVVKNFPPNVGDMRDTGRSPGGGQGHPLQCSCWKSMGRGAWWATAHAATKGWT